MEAKAASYDGPARLDDDYARVAKADAVHRSNLLEHRVTCFASDRTSHTRLGFILNRPSESDNNTLARGLASMLVVFSLESANTFTFHIQRKKWKL